jgi:hypothetical protein
MGGDRIATRDDVEQRLGRALGPDEDARFDVAAGDVEAHLRIAAPRIPARAPFPAAVVRVASELVIAALAAPPGGGGDVAAESLGGYSVTYRQPGSAGLSDLHAQLLAPWSRPRIGTMTTSTAVAAP